MRSDYDRPVGESKLGDVFLALLLLPCVGITGAVLVAGVVIYTRERTLGGAREMTSLALAAVLFPLLTRALYVVAALPLICDLPHDSRGCLTIQRRPASFARPRHGMRKAPRPCGGGAS